MILQRFRLLVSLLLLGLAGCGTLEVGMERAPQAASDATVAALATENAQLSTQVAALKATPADTPMPTPTTTLGKLAYVQGGDIWVKALPDGEAKRLTTDGHNSAPRWSPSGAWLLFRKNEQTWVMSAGGGNARVVSQQVAAWSPNADLLAFVPVSEPQALQVMNPDGTDVVMLVPAETQDGSRGEIDQIVWSADGAWLAYRWNGIEPSVHQTLWKVSADGRTRMELFIVGGAKTGDLILAGWSPSGKQLFFWQSEIRSASIVADGLPLYSILTDQPFSSGPAPQRAGTQVTLVHADFFAPAPAGSSWGTHDSMALVTGGGRSTWTNKRIELAASTLTLDDVAAIWPAWSPDGEQLAYAAMPDQGEDGNSNKDDPWGLRLRHLWIMNSSGEPQPRQLTNDPAYRDERPLWSADGSHLLFARIDTEGRSSVWLIPAAGGTAQRVVDELTPAPDPFGFYGYINWSTLFDWWPGQEAQPTLQPTSPTTATPDVPATEPAVTASPIAATPIAAVSPNLAGLVYRQPDGLYQVTSSGEITPWSKLASNDVAISPDGERILYSQDGDIWLSDLTTGQRRNLTRSPERNDIAPQWWPAQPDLVLFSTQGQESAGPNMGQPALINTDGSNFRIISDEGLEGLSNSLPAASPDGRTIAYDRGGTAWLYQFDTGPLSFDPSQNGLDTLKGVQNIGSPSFSPDGKKVAWVVGMALNVGWRIGMAVFDLQTRSAQIVHLYEPAGRDGWPPAAVWSPDGQWLAVATWDDDSSVWLVRADGQPDEARNLGGPANQPTWSPDGQRLVFIQHIPDRAIVMQATRADNWQPQPAFPLPAGSTLVGWRT